MIVALAALAAATMPCTPVPGAEKLWRPEIRWVVIGEMHGTAETPPAFLNLACLAARSGRPVTVALEYPSDCQPELDAFLASDGGPQARSALLTLPIWHSPMPDGRSSRAFQALIEGLRRLRQTRMIDGVVASDDSYAMRGVMPRDAAMARQWQAIPAPAGGVILVLVGNFHAIRRSVGPQGTMHPSASLLPADRTVTVNVVGNGGSAWNCMSDGCGVHSNGPPRQAERGIHPLNDAERRWDTVYELGVPTTASPPAVAESPQAHSPT